MTENKPTVSELDATLKAATFRFIDAEKALNEDRRTNAGYDAASIAQRKDCERRFRSAEKTLEEARHARRQHPPD